MKVMFLFFLFFLFVFSTYGESFVVCTAKGKKTSNQGQMLNTDAKVNFKVNDFDPSKDKVMILSEVKGSFKIGDEGDEPLNNDNAYVGIFSFEKIKSNPDYKPKKYKNMVQFKDFDAKKTTGYENGMWGAFLLDKNLKDGSNAKYVFQAGDHLGGTIHFTCQIAE